MMEILYCKLYDFLAFHKGIHGGWTDYGPWSACSKTCTNKGPGDVARKTRDRTCTNPSPSNGGDDCVGVETDYEVCNQNVPCGM